MATTLPYARPLEWTLADLVAELGGVPLSRIRMVPPPGMATEKDVLEILDRTDRICELIDGVLVEKPMGFYESFLATTVSYRLMAFLETYDLGIVLGAAGTLKILPTQVRIPDVCFIAWDRFPGRKLPAEPIPAVAPDLAVEILSEGNTEQEMERKLRDYFAAGVRLVWYIDWKSRTAKVYTAIDRCDLIDENQDLDGADVLPGFRLRLKDLFARADRQGPGGPPN